MIMPRTLAHVSDSQADRMARARLAQALALVTGDDGLRETKTGQNYQWVAQVCGTANQNAGGGCGPNGPPCSPVTLGYPQGAAAGVVATTAQGVFPFVAPAKIVPYQLVISGTGQAFQVIDFHAGLMGPLIAGLATSPLGADLFGPNVQEPVPLKAIWIDAGVTMSLTLLNPTLNNLTFVGSLKCVLA